MVTLAAARVISEDSIRVHGIVCANDSQAAVTIVFEDSANVALLTVEVGANDTQEISTMWLADTGLGIRIGAATTIVTVFHGQPGA
jgi:hypothetical protein